MPELPEVEVVRRGLGEFLPGARVLSVRVLHPRAARRHPGGGDFLVAALTGRMIVGVFRRGKYLWLVLDDDHAVVMHLGMSGQFRVISPQGVAGGGGNPSHLRIEVVFTDDRVLQFYDQRTFGGWEVAELVQVEGEWVPAPVAHIARDPFDGLFDAGGVTRRVRGKKSAIKRVLLDQTVVSGVGNIYADESLWRARIHGETVASALSVRAVRGLLDHVSAVMRESISVGGTSFDALYVNVNGESGRFSQWLAVYGQDGSPCRRCGAVIRRESFMNRGSHFCPRCQVRKPE